MPDHKELRLVWCSRAQAKAVCHRNHYMATYPQGAKVNLAVVDPQDQVVGIVVFGYSSRTADKVERLVHGLDRSQYLEMQRLWISDDYGHNTESWVLARVMRLLRDTYNLQLVVTHAGGCKDDCGIVYQASGWLFFGSSRCSDFYETQDGQYKNMVAAMRFGRVKVKGRTRQEIGHELFGPGLVVEAHRHLYVYPIHKGIRRRLAKLALPYPKNSARFRRDQQWVDDGGAAGAGHASVAGSIPAPSTSAGPARG